VYAPSAFAETEELIALCPSMAARGGQYFTHMRGEAHTLLESIAEPTRIAEESGVPLNGELIVDRGQFNAARRSALHS
jgi:N-acyl-D-amino-acid deacylase